MQKIFYLFLLTILLNGCVETIGLLGSSVGGASSGKLVQSSLQSTISYGIKRQTGKSPLGHALAYAEKNNPERKKETCISFVEKTRSEFCTIAKNKISLTNRAVKEKIASTVKKIPKAKDLVSQMIVIKPKNEVILKNSSYVNSFNQSKKTPRELAIIFQTEMKNLKEKLIKKYLTSG